MGLVGNLQEGGRNIGSLKHRPILLRNEGGRQEGHLGLGRQRRLQRFDHRLEAIARGAAVREDFEDLDLTRRHGGMRRVWQDDVMGSGGNRVGRAREAGQRQRQKTAERHENPSHRTPGADENWARS